MDKKREVMLIACPCGKVKKLGDWVRVRMSFSDFISLALRQNIISFEFPVGLCPDCQKEVLAVQRKGELQEDA